MSQETQDPKYYLCVFPLSRMPGNATMGKAKKIRYQKRKTVFAFVGLWRDSADSSDNGRGKPSIHAKFLFAYGFSYESHFQKKKK